MEEDFGLLVDFLHGELDDEDVNTLRRRLENEPELFEEFEKLRRTYQVLNCSPKSL